MQRFPWLAAAAVAGLAGLGYALLRGRPNATCTTVGVQHENGRSYASARAEATGLRRADMVIYEIAWAAAVAPVGHPLLNAVAKCGQ